MVLCLRELWHHCFVPKTIYELRKNKRWMISYEAFIQKLFECSYSTSLVIRTHITKLPQYAKTCWVRYCWLNNTLEGFSLGFWEKQKVMISMPKWEHNNMNMISWILWYGMCIWKAYCFWHHFQMKAISLTFRWYDGITFINTKFL